jgi:hypothetical protein
VSAKPSIKATGFQSAADDLAQLVATGRVSRAELEARLPRGDFAYLDKALAASSWVPIDTYVRVGAILVELEGASEPQAYFRARGLRAAARLHKAGLYRQFEASVEAWGKRAGTLATTIAAVLYNFTRWSFEARPDRQGFEIAVDDAREFPEYLRFVGEGMIEYMSQHLSPGRKPRVSSKRVAPDRIVYVVQVD